MKRFYRVVARELKDSTSAHEGNAQNAIVADVPVAPVWVGYKEAPLLERWVAVISNLGEFLKGNAGSKCEVVGSKCEEELPRLSPHSSSYSPLTLAAPIGRLQLHYMTAQQEVQQGGGK